LDQDHYGFDHLGFQEYLTAREIRTQFLKEMVETGTSNLLNNLAHHFGKSWWQKIILMVLSFEDPSLFIPYIRELTKLPDFAKNADLVEMCLKNAAKTSARPFLDLLMVKTPKDREFWERQHLALQMIERLSEKKLKVIMQRHWNHPYAPIRQWIKERFKQAQQDVIWPEPSGYELVLIKGGTFMMGSDERDSEKPVHEVTVPDFYMGRYLVTNEEYERFIQATGYKEPRYWGDRNYNQPQQPVVGINWHDVKSFAKWAGLQLPSEAQWEYACRAGTQAMYSWGDEPDCAKANYGNSAFSKERKDINPGKPSVVGNYPPNALGLYDMHGNVWEWCEDHWHDNYKGAPADGSAWVDRDEGTARVLRGGSWCIIAGFCRSAFRGWDIPVNRHDFYGFRLVRPPGQPGEPGRSGKGDAQCAID
jgi:formylglycine-generating enzyme required for sulfatase activity